MQQFSEFIGESKKSKSAMERMFSRLFRQMRNESDSGLKIEYVVKLNAIAAHLNEQQVRRLVQRL